jgi:hypothetical protein
LAQKAGPFLFHPKPFPALFLTDLLKIPFRHFSLGG